MAKISVEKFVEQLSVEAAVLNDCIRLVSGFSDFVYFTYLLDTRITSLIEPLRSSKALPMALADTAYRSLLAPVSRITTWEAEARATYRFENKKALSASFIFSVNVPRRRELVSFLDDAEKTLSPDQKAEFAMIATRSLKHHFLTSFLSLKAIPKNMRLQVMLGYCSSCGWDNPYFLRALPKDVRETFMTDMKDYGTGPQIEVNDEMVKLGRKKGVLVDIAGATQTAFLEYGKSLVQAFQNADSRALSRSVAQIRALVDFFGETDDKLIPSEQMIAFDGRLNLHTVLSTIRAGQFQHPNNDPYFAVGEIPSDIQGRRFYIRFPGDFTCLSAISALDREQEYRQSAARFALSHQQEHVRSLRGCNEITD